jgi:hypothetical protein
MVRWGDLVVYLVLRPTSEKATLPWIILTHLRIFSLTDPEDRWNSIECEWKDIVEQSPKRKQSPTQSNGEIQQELGLDPETALLVESLQKDFGTTGPTYIIKA